MSKDIFEMFDHLECMLSQKMSSRPKSKPQPVQPMDRGLPIPMDEVPRLKPKIPKYSSPYLEKHFGSPNKSKRNNHCPRRAARIDPNTLFRRSKTKLAEAKLLQLYFLRWMKRCADRLDQEEEHQAPQRKVSFTVGTERYRNAKARKTDVEEEETISQIDLQLDSLTFPGPGAGVALSSSEIVDPTSFDIQDTPDPSDMSGLTSPRGELRFR